jgi:hypothetical protein
VNPEGRVEEFQHSPEPAAQLLREFLEAIQRPGPVESEDWQLLSSDPSLIEYAVWLNGAMVEQVLQGSLDRQSVRLSDFQGWNERLRTRSFVEHSGNWVAITLHDGAFDRLIDRREVLESVASQVVKGAGD